MGKGGQNLAALGVIAIWKGEGGGDRAALRSYAALAGAGNS